MENDLLRRNTELVLEKAGQEIYDCLIGYLEKTGDPDFIKVYKDFKKLKFASNHSEAFKTWEESEMELEKAKIKYAWHKGRQLCLDAFQGKRYGFPFEYMDMEGYMELYKLESFPHYIEMKDRRQKAYTKAVERMDQEEKACIDDYSDFMSFELMRASYYMGYLTGTICMPNYIPGYVEDRYLTMVLKKQIGLQNDMKAAKICN